MEELTELARDLVRIPSHEDPTAAGDRVEHWLRSETDAVVRRDDAGNVIARRSASAGTEPLADDASESLALVGHHDVVPPAERQVDGEEFVVERRDGRLYGRGSADMKGAVAAAMLAFRDAELDAPESAVAPELVFASFVGEETGGEGARYAIDDGFSPAYAVVGEGSTGYSSPGTTDVAVAHKGRRASTVAATGESVHASVPEEGTNAIYLASDAVDRLREMDAPSVSVAGDVLEGSLAVTEIEGGTAWNVVPDRCAVTVDERTVPGERAPVETLSELPGVSVSVDQDLPPMRCTDDAFVDAVVAAARSNHDADQGRPERVVKPHATDAGWLSQAGTQCVVVGPSEPGEAHTAEESVSLSVLERCYGIYRDVAERFPPAEG